MSIYLLRHGQTQWNKVGFIQGRYDVPLNEEGIRQAEEARKKFEGIQIDYCFSSPLKRAKQTAEIALASRNIEIKEDDRLVEMAYGVFEGQPCKLGEFQYQRRQLPSRFKNGENYFDVVHRAYSFLDEVVSLSKDHNILIVCHGAIGRAIKSYFLSSSTNDAFIDTICPNGGIEKYEYAPRNIPVKMVPPDKGEDL